MSQHFSHLLCTHAWSLQCDPDALEGLLRLPWATHLHTPENCASCLSDPPLLPTFRPVFLCFPLSAARQNGGRRAKDLTEQIITAFLHKPYLVEEGELRSFLCTHTVPKVIAKGTRVSKHQSHSADDRPTLSQEFPRQRFFYGSFFCFWPSSSLLIMALWGNLGQAPSPNRKGRAVSN